MWIPHRPQTDAWRYVATYLYVRSCIATSGSLKQVAHEPPGKELRHPVNGKADVPFGVTTHHHRSHQFNEIIMVTYQFQTEKPLTETQLEHLAKALDTLPYTDKRHRTDVPDWVSDIELVEEADNNE